MQVNMNKSCDQDFTR